MRERAPRCCTRRRSRERMHRWNVLLSAVVWQRRGVRGSRGVRACVRHPPRARVPAGDWTCRYRDTRAFPETLIHACERHAKKKFSLVRCGAARDTPPPPPFLTSESLRASPYCRAAHCFIPDATPTPTLEHYEPGAGSERARGEREREWGWYEALRASVVWPVRSCSALDSAYHSRVYPHGAMHQDLGWPHNTSAFRGAAEQEAAGCLKLRSFTP